jgi:hypothetical protein
MTRQPFKLNRENFYDLPQLDRIEYRQRENRLRKDFSGSTFAVAMAIFFFMIAFMLITTLLFYIAFGSIWLAMATILIFFFKLYVIVIIACFIIDFYRAFQFRKFLHLLDDEYADKLPMIDVTKVSCKKEHPRTQYMREYRERKRREKAERNRRKTTRRTIRR